MNDSAIPLSALGRLNAHVRAGSGFFSGSNSRAVYAYKTVETLTLAERGAITVRFVQWKGECNRCIKGRFSHYSWSDGYTVPCRDCRGTGHRTLRFTETTLPDGQVWHHPWDGRDAQGRHIAEAVVGTIKWIPHTYEVYAVGEKPIEWNDTGGWRPHLPATKLPLADLVALLNEVEDWIETLSGGPHNWLIDTAKRYLRPQKADYDGFWEAGYSLDLGLSPDGCFICGKHHDPAERRYGRMDGMFHWTLPLCNDHGDVPFPKDPPPTSMITPDIRRWIDRRARSKVYA